jgi:hypothetical protein
MQAEEHRGFVMTAPAFDLPSIYQQAAYDAAVEGVFSLAYTTPATEKGKTSTMYVQHFKPERMPELVSAALNYSASANVYFTPSLRQASVSKGKVGKFEDIVAVLGLVLEEDADERKWLTLPPGIEPTAIIRTSYIPAENRHFHFVYDRALDPREARELADLARVKCGGDSGNADIVKPWRLPNTQNFPNWKKIERGRPRSPQPVEIVGGTGLPVKVDALRAALEAMPYLHPERHKPPSSKPKGLHKRKERGNGASRGEEATGSISKRDRLLLKLRPELRDAIDTEGEDRSAHCASVMFSLLNAGLAYDDILLIATGAAFARKFEERKHGDLEKEIDRLTAKWEADREARESEAEDEAEPAKPKASTKAQQWDLNQNRKRLPNRHNALLAFQLEGVSLCYDEFSYETQIHGLDGHGPALTDIAEKTLWLTVWENYGIKFGREDFRAIIDVAAFENRVHPPREYFAAVQPTWDGVSRIDTWAIDYLGVEDTKVNRFICRKSLIANVRRARKPGVKYDTMTTLEGPQDFGKSSALATLCPRLEWFTDNFAFNHKSGREDITQSQGKLMIEIPELSGMKPTAVHHTKALLSRQFDECDLKYEKRATRRGRQACFWGTTNEHAYLFDETGNRRVWPLRCGVTCTDADLDGLAKVRDQLWAEAAHYEATGETIHATEADMKEELASITDLRQVHDEWEPKVREKLIEVANACEGEGKPVRTTILDVKEALTIPLDAFDKTKQERVRSCMRAVGWGLTSGGSNGGPLKRKGRELWEPVRVGWQGANDEDETEATASPPDPEVPF